MAACNLCVKKEKPFPHIMYGGKAEADGDESEENMTACPSSGSLCVQHHLGHLQNSGLSGPPLLSWHPRWMGFVKHKAFSCDLFSHCCPYIGQKPNDLESPRMSQNVCGAFGGGGGGRQP